MSIVEFAAMLFIAMVVGPPLADLVINICHFVAVVVWEIIKPVVVPVWKAVVVPVWKALRVVVGGYWEWSGKIAKKNLFALSCIMFLNGYIIPFSLFFGVVFAYEKIFT